MGHPERIPVPASVYCEAYNYALSPTRGGSGGAVTNLPQKEQSEVFFSVTKLFQNKDVNLRRMVRPRNWQQRKGRWLRQSAAAVCQHGRTWVRRRFSNCC